MKQKIISGFRATTVLAMGALLAGCSGNSGTIGSTPMSLAAAQEAALIERVDDIFDGQGVTTTVETLPLAPATYSGLLHGFSNGAPGPTPGPDVEYFADLSLTADFYNSTFDGTADNFRTDLAGFTAPSGSVALLGSIGDDAGNTTASFDGGSFLTGADFDADILIDAFSGADEGFIGNSAQAARGAHDSTIFWDGGPHDSLTSYADGDWNVEQ